MKRTLFATLVLALLISVLPFGVHAEEAPSLFVPAEITLTESKQAKTVNADSYVTAEEAGVQLRSLLKSRTASIELYVADENWSYEMILEEVFAVAVAHTGVPTEGDYLLGHIAGWSGEVYQEELGDNVCGHIFVLNFEYLTTAEQEAELDSAVRSRLSTTTSRKILAMTMSIWRTIPTS